MTQKEIEIIKKSFLDSIETYVDTRLKKLDFVKTQIGVITAVTTVDNKYMYTVVCNKTATTSGVIYENVTALDNIQYSVNDVVFLIAPNAQFSNQFILGSV